MSKDARRAAIAAIGQPCRCDADVPCPPVYVNMASGRGGGGPFPECVAATLVHEFPRDLVAIRASVDENE